MKTLKQPKLLLILLMALSLPSMAYAEYEIETGRCYPAANFFYFVTKKLTKHSYVIQSQNVIPQYQEAIFKPSYEFAGLGRVGGKMKIIGQTEVEMDNGFSRNLYVFQDCKE